jgi:hypothetical protein
MYFNGKILTDASTDMYTAYQVKFRMVRRFECVCRFVRRLRSDALGLKMEGWTGQVIHNLSLIP